MGQHYTDAAREADPHALPDVEVFEVKESDIALNVRFSTGGPRDLLRRDVDISEAGWYYWYAMPGCMPDSDAIGPFETETDALHAAREDAGFCEHGAAEDGAECEECAPMELWGIRNARGAWLVFGVASSVTETRRASCYVSEAAARAMLESMGAWAEGWTVARLTDAESRAWSKAGA
jgi:hypothetical protein